MRMSNLLILSSGGNGHVTIPLLKQIEPSKSAQIEQTPKTKGALFVGTVNNLRPARLKAFNEVKQLPGQLSKQIQTYHGDKVCLWRILTPFILLLRFVPLPQPSFLLPPTPRRWCHLSGERSS